MDSSLTRIGSRPRTESGGTRSDKDYISRGEARRFRCRVESSNPPERREACGGPGGADSWRWSGITVGMARGGEFERIRVFGC